MFIHDPRIDAQDNMPLSQGTVGQSTVREPPKEHCRPLRWLTGLLTLFPWGSAGDLPRDGYALSMASPPASSYFSVCISKLCAQRAGGTGAELRVQYWLHSRCVCGRWTERGHFPQLGSQQSGLCVGVPWEFQFCYGGGGLRPHPMMLRNYYGLCT